MLPKEIQDKPLERIVIFYDLFHGFGISYRWMEHGREIARAYPLQSNIWATMKFWKDKGIKCSLKSE